jgi:hypothetical protein
MSEIETIHRCRVLAFAFVEHRHPSPRAQGPDLLAVQQSKRHAFARASYVVIDLATGATLGTIMPNRDGWEIVDTQVGRSWPISSAAERRVQELRRQGW